MPSSAVQKVYLSSLDHLQPSLQTRILYVYRIADGARDREALLSKLESSLRVAVEKEMPFLMAPLHRDPVAEGGRLWLDMAIERQRPLKITTAVLDEWTPSADALRAGTTEGWPMAQLNPDTSGHDGYTFDESGEEHVALFKAHLTLCSDVTSDTSPSDTFLIVATHTCHCVGDAATSIKVMERWAAYFREGEAKAFSCPIEEKPLFDPSRLRLEHPHDAPKVEAPATCVRFNPTSASKDLQETEAIAKNAVWARLHVSSADLEKLRTQCQNEISGEAKLSKNDVLVVHVSKAFHLSMGPATDAPVHAIVPVNIRGRHPRVPPSFVGNGLVNSCVTFPSGKMLVDPGNLAKSAELVHRGVRALTDPNGVDKVVAWESQLESRVSGFWTPGDDVLVFTSWMHLGIFETADLGPALGGRPLMATCAPPLTMPGVCYCHPPQPGMGDGIDVLLGLWNKEQLTAITSPEMGFMGTLLGELIM